MRCGLGAREVGSHRPFASTLFLKIVAWITMPFGATVLLRELADVY
jgi:hypothetical protein